MTVQEKLEQLVNRRFNKEGLQEQLKEILGKTLQVVEVPADELLLAEDYRLDIGTKESGYGSIWFLKTRTDNIYVTEVVYEEE